MIGWKRALGVEIYHSELRGTLCSRLREKRGVVRFFALSLFCFSIPVAMQAQSSSTPLPDAPSALLLSADSGEDGAQSPASPENATGPQSAASSSTRQSSAADQAASALLPPCPKHSQTHGGTPQLRPPLCEPADQLQLIVDAGHVSPLSSAQKGVLAIRAVTDPFNLLTIGAFSAISVAADSHSVYGPGFKGWGRLSGYSFAVDTQEEFTGVYLIPSLVHEDPRYHRMPGAPVRRRIEHALIHTFVSQHDDGALMPNYATIINYPLTAEISNLYVPGIATNGISTAKRVFVGYATDPVGPLVAEFLPDVAKRVHIHIVFAQQILNHIALGSGAQPASF